MVDGVWVENKGKGKQMVEAYVSLSKGSTYLALCPPLCPLISPNMAHPHTIHYLSSLLRLHPIKPDSPSPDPALGESAASFTSDSGLTPEVLADGKATDDLRARVLDLLQQEDEDGLKKVLKAEFGIHVRLLHLVPLLTSGGCKRWGFLI